MSILNFPRINFKGAARLNLPTGNRNIAGTLDIATNTVYQDGVLFDLKKHPSAFHQYLRQLPPRFNLQGMPDDLGIFNQAAGHNFLGNNHFSWENTQIISLQIQPGILLENDALLGCKVELWGHYNEYLRTTFNRARWVEIDPSRDDTSQIYAGQLCIKEATAMANTPFLFSSDIHSVHSVRWYGENHIREKQPHFLEPEFSKTRVFQFSIPKDSEHFIFNQLGFKSEFFEYLQRELQRDDVLGLSIQYSVFNMSTPLQPDTPVFYDLSGTIGLWLKQDMATFANGRVLYPKNSHGFGPVTIKTQDNWASISMPCSIPFMSREAKCTGQLTHALGPKYSLGELELRNKSGVLLAIIPEAIYGKYWKTAGIFDVPLLNNMTDDSLILRGTGNQWEESDWLIQAEQNVISLEAPDRKNHTSFSKDLKIFSYFRGKPKGKKDISIFIENKSVVSTSQLTLSSNENGLAFFTVTSEKPGVSEVFVDDQRSKILVRVLPDDWALLDTPDHKVDYTFLYEQVMSYYELIYPFMADKVFSMADQCKCETYARLMWQMCDPLNRDKSYYMPSTREMSYAKSILFLKYLSNVEASALSDQHNFTLASNVKQNEISSKEELVLALKKAVNLELSIMLQYIYAAYSLPTFAAGEQLMLSNKWSFEQLALVCGGADRRHNSGWRGTILEIAHEEMIHYLVVNNLLMSLGEPFFPGTPLFGLKATEVFGLDTEFSFEPFSENVLAKFVRFEWPHYFPSTGKSIAEFYALIRRAFENIPNLFANELAKTSGEHHLFLNELTNRKFPAYQLEINNQETALFAIDFVTEQGEGGASDSPYYAQSHFNRLREILRTLLASKIPFEPAFPVLKNPVLDPMPGCNTVLNPQARQLMHLYKGCHELTFHMMIQHFEQKPLGSLRRSRLMNAAIDIMSGILRPLSVQIMTLPSGVPGRNAGPPVPQAIQFELITDYGAGCVMLAQQCRALAKFAREIQLIQPAIAQIELLEFYDKQMMELATGKLSREG
ncbi:iminophenyl-pyruvate dimer synthase VioB [Fluviispira multicolorata]|uniref:Iminophenyl-pyruvate dimer synthase VioB n=1 Tax=Fluviispira multicolorata TaxID=2654512 RepID=A0A833JFM2_9BACT|nr:iminophenyl-pyruvate dimer synthase VioB [Fluviispira multicolorata]KAB8033468.1 iminophenyl-pyruvate dimer synthase VioB [Fluviispira multicolorata]